MSVARKRAGRTLCALLGLALVPAIGCAHRVPGSSTTPLRIYLARHGQTDWNVQRILQGWTDTELNATGRKQAVELAERLQGLRLDAIYSSTLRRSRETATVAARGRRVESLDGLREQSVGKFEGLKLDGSDSAKVAEYRRRSRDPDDALDGGESENQFFSRVQSTLETIQRRHPSGAILIVGHGGTNKMILRSLLGLTAAQSDSIHQANDEVYLVEVAAGGRPRLWKMITATRLEEL